MNKYGEVLENVDLKNYNTYGISSKAKYLIKPSNIDNLKNLIVYLKENNIKYYVFGNGSNIIIPDHDFDGVIIKLDKLKTIEYNDNVVKVDAGVKLNNLVEDTINHGFGNLYFLAGIPATVGGAVVQNAGSYNHCIFEYVKSIEILDNDEIKRIDKKDIKYDYRYTEFKDKKNVIILSCTFNLEKADVLKTKELIKQNFEKRANTQPLQYRNAGSVFKNPDGDSAGRIIDELGLKGLTVGGAKISDIHGNFIINFNSCTASDIIELINKVKSIVKEKKNIDLELEQEIINW